MNDIDKRVSECEAKLKRRPLGHPNRASALAGLSVALDDRFRLRGGLKDINRCIKLDSEVIILRPKGHPKYIASLNNLSTGLRSRFKLTGDSADLERSLEIDEESLALRPPGHPKRPASLARLSVGLTDRFHHTGDLADLNRSIELDEEVIEIRQLTDHTELSDAYLNLSVAFFTRFRATKDIADLDRSIELDLQALAGRSGVDRADSLASLAISVRTRFREFGDFADLQRSIDLDEEALNLRPLGHDERVESLGNLSIALHLRYQHTDSLDDLDRCLELDEEVLSLRPPEHPERGEALTELSVSYHTRFQAKEDIADLNRSLELDREALDFYPKSHPDRVTAMRDIAISLVVRFDYLHKQEDLREAMKLYKQAFSLLKPGHPSRFRILVLISSLYMKSENQEKDPAASVESLRAAMQESQIISQSDMSEVCNLLVRIQAKTAASDVQVKQPLLAAYRHFMSFLPRIAYLGMEMSSRLRVLNKTSEVTMSACLCALQLGCPRDALEILEEGRAVSWSQSLRLRSSFEDLPNELSCKLRLLATKLEAVVNLKEERGVHSDDDSDDGADTIPTSPDAKAAYARKLTKDFEDALATARQLPGFESFLLPMSYPGLAKAAERGPVVVLMAHSKVCYAIILQSPEANPEHISLPKLSTKWLMDSTDTLRRSTSTSREALPKDGRAMRKIESCPPDDDAYKLLGELWIKICKPVIDNLGLQQGEGKDRRRVWWCPTGPFVFLPIHAAGIYKAGSADYCSQYMISSYTPTVAALSNAHRDLRPISRKAAQVLLAAVPYTSVDDDLEPLPNTVKEVETIRGMIPAEHVLQIPDEDGLITRYPSLSTRSIVDALPAASILHFAGHGRQDLEQPLNSGFAMRDGMLTLATLMTFNLPNAFLAFLSACESAKGDPKEPDQTVHLAAAMLFTGFRSVVATMWSMNDFDGPTVARQVYENLFHGSREHFEPDDVPYALDAAAHELRIAGAHPSRWATFIHLGI